MLAALRKTDIAVDLGTSKIAVVVRGEGRVFEEPACIAFRGPRRDPRSVVAIGDEAVQMRGKTPPEIELVWPIKDGVVSDCHAAGILLWKLLAKHQVGRGLRRRRFLVGTLFGASSMERRAFEQVALVAGASSVALVHEPLAAAVGAGLPIEEPQANMIVDIGAGASEAMVVSLKAVAGGGSLRVGGDAMSEAIKQSLHRSIGLDIGLGEATRLKEAVAAPLGPDTLLEARGLDVRLRRPRRARVRGDVLRSALTLPINAIVSMVQNVVDGLPAELAADLIERGITLAGGGAATETLRRGIEHATHVTVKPLTTPHQAVINGCGRMLGYRDRIA
jgi:rod shape-determining protein MreB